MSFIEPSTFSHSIMTVGVLEFTESHSGENIIDRIDAIILSFQIPTISHINDISILLNYNCCLYVCLSVARERSLECKLELP